jgi:hypothetical protein
MTGVGTPSLPHTCHVTKHLAQICLIKLIIFGEDHRSRSSSLCSLLQWPVTSSIVFPNIFLSTLLSNTLRLWSSLNVRDQVSCPHKTTGKVINQYILIYIYIYFWICNLHCSSNISGMVNAQRLVAAGSCSRNSLIHSPICLTTGP